MIKAEMPHLPMLVVSMHDEVLYAERALRAGARGYVMKREALDSILSAVRSVLAGDIYVSPTMSKRMIEEHISTGGRARSGVEKLTDRELEILQLIGDGKEVRTIARELHLSAKTVEAHRRAHQRKAQSKQRSGSGPLRHYLGESTTLGRRTVHLPRARSGNLPIPFCPSVPLCGPRAPSPRPCCVARAYSW